THPHCSRRLPAPTQHLHSFPTRRSSDLTTRRRNPAAPFTTSTMQQEAARKLGFTARRTMRVAQQLYEGLSLGELGTHGLITYMRSEEHTSELQSRENLVCRLLLEKKKHN